MCLYQRTLYGCGHKKLIVMMPCDAAYRGYNPWAPTYKESTPCCGHNNSKSTVQDRRKERSCKACRKTSWARGKKCLRG